MAMVTPPPPGGRVTPSALGPFVHGVPKVLVLIAGVLLPALAGGGYWWFVARVEVAPDQILILVNKTGKTLPDELRDEFGDQVILYPDLVKAVADRTGKSEAYVKNHYKGIRYEVLTAGRYFLHPYYYKRLHEKATVIGQNQVGVLIRKYGKPLPFPKTVATEPDERGPVAQILKPGRHNINLLAHEVQTFDAIRIPAGHVGVVTLLSGTDPKIKNTYTVEPGEKGVQTETLPPGTKSFRTFKDCNQKQC